MNELMAGQTIDAVRRAIASSLRKNFIETPELDARLLLGEVLQLGLTAMMAAGEQQLTPAETEAAQKLLERRAAGEPVARILGRKEFWGMEFHLSEATLVPRPETETIVEAAIEAMRLSGLLNDPLRIADIGTGSGVILVALLSELAHAEGVGTDISQDAIETAKLNAQRLGVGDRAAFIKSDYASALSGPFELIVSNPPYIRSQQIDLLPIEVRVHDPRLALDGGEDGLEAYRQIISQACAMLVPGGFLILEAGRGQASDIARIMTAHRLTLPCAAKADLAGIPRAVIGRKTVNPDGSSA